MPVCMELKDDRSERVQYDDPDYPIYLREGILSHYPNYSAATHWHDDIEMIAVTSGEMKYNVNGEVVKLREGEGILVNARQMHFGYSDTRTECLFICILLHPALLCPNSSYEHDFVLPVIRNGSAPFVFLSEEIEWKKEVLGEIYRMYENRGKKTTPLIVQASFARIWEIIYEKVPRVKAEDESRDLLITKNMVGFIQKNYGKKISLKDIAAAGAVGQSKCCILFSRYFHQSPNAYLNQYRLNKSMELLRNTDLSVTEIALGVGFGGASYYAEIFRKWSGKSPSQFRKS